MYKDLPKVAIRGAAGFGDSVYLLPIVEWLAKKYDNPSNVTICSKHPDIFKHLGVTTEPFRRTNINVCATYAHNRHSPRNQYDDILKYGNLPHIEFKIDWKVTNTELLDKIKEEANGRKICVLPSATRPFNNDENKFADVMPDNRVLQILLDRYKEELFIIKVGQGDQLYEYKNIDLDLHGQTSCTDILDIGTIADILLGQPSYLVPIAQIFKKRLFCILSRKMINSKNPTLRMLKPHKYKMLKTDVVLWDNSDFHQIDEEFRKCL